MRRTSIRRTNAGAAAPSAVNATQGAMAAQSAHDARGDDNDTEYTVKAIVGEKHRRGKVLYEVQWQDFPGKDSCISYYAFNDKRMVNDFEKQRKSAKQDSFKAQRESAQASIMILQRLCKNMHIVAKKAIAHESKDEQPSARRRT